MKFCPLQSFNFIRKNICVFLFDWQKFESTGWFDFLYKILVFWKIPLQHHMYCSKNFVLGVKKSNTLKTKLNISHMS